MILTLMRDLMNLAQMSANTFSMVDDYFNCTQVIKKCISVVAAHSNLKQVQVIGPIFNNPIDKYYFQELYSDER